MLILEVACDVEDGQGAAVFGRRVDWPGTPSPGQRFTDSGATVFARGSWSVEDVVFDVSEPGELRVQLEPYDAAEVCEWFYETNPDAERHTWQCNFAQVCESLLEAGWVALAPPIWRGLGEPEVLVRGDEDDEEEGEEQPDPERN